MFRIVYTLLQNVKMQFKKVIVQEIRDVLIIESNFLQTTCNIIFFFKDSHICMCNTIQKILNVKFIGPTKYN